MLCEPKNKVMKKSNYCIVLLFFILLGSISAWSQDKPEKKFSFEIGVNHSFAARKVEAFDNDYGLLFYLEGRRKISQPLSVALQLDLSEFYRDSKYGGPYTFISLGVIPTLYYDFQIESKIKPFAGIGAGVAFSNIKAVFNDGYETNFCFMPSVGVRVFRHFTVAVNYELINKNYSHANARIGFYF